MPTTFTVGDHVVVTETVPELAGETGTVTNPEYMGYVIIALDNPELQEQSLGCFLPEELARPSSPKEGTT